MRSYFLLFSAVVMTTLFANGQTVATFETLPLAHADTFYSNFTASGTDVGFDDGLAHFKCVYDTSWGGFWEQGFAYSNMTDSVTSGVVNQYAAKTAIGHGGSANYAVAYCYNPSTFGSDITIRLNDSAIGHPVKGFYVTNSTYAYNSMRDGDGFARKFHNGDWFKLVARGYYGGTMKPDSVGFYLANFLHPDSSNNYIVNTWEWFDLEPLGKVDSIQFTLSSTDNGSFGMNTPAYFCMDDFTTYESFDTSSPTTAVADLATPVVKAYPIPATNELHVEINNATATSLRITDMNGRVVYAAAAGQNNTVDISALATGTYVLLVNSEQKTATLRFIKQ